MTTPYEALRIDVANLVANPGPVKRSEVSALLEKHPVPEELVDFFADDFFDPNYFD